MNKDFESLRERLEELTYPSVYMFKFIVKTELQKIAQIEGLFDPEKAEIIRKESSKGAFISIRFNTKLVKKQSRSKIG